MPEETCSMAPEEECKNVTTSIPQANTSSLKVTFANNSHFPSWCLSRSAGRCPKRFAKRSSSTPGMSRSAWPSIWRVLPVSVGQFPHPVMQPVAKCDGRKQSNVAYFDNGHFPQEAVAVKYCTNPSTGVVEPQEDFALNARRNPRAGQKLVQQQLQQQQFQKLQLQQQQLQQQQLQPQQQQQQSAVLAPGLPVPSVLALPGLGKGGKGRRGGLRGNKERLLRGRLNAGQVYF